MSAAALPFVLMGAQAVGQLTQGAEARNAAYAQARVDEENARLALLSGEQDALQSMKDARQATGALIADNAGSGVQLGTGTAADLIAANAYQSQLEILGIRTRATREANNLYQSAEDKRKAGRSAMTQAMFGAVTGALSGVSASGNQARLAASSAQRRSVELGGGTGMVPKMRVGY